MILTIRDQASVRELKDRMRRSDRLATLGMIAAGIAHEVKNPLVGISGAAQLMKSELRSAERSGKRTGLASGQLEYLEVILKEADRLNKVLEGILDFTRLRPLEIKGCNIHSILDHVLLLNEESARQSNVVLARLYDPSLPEVLGNRDQLVQVFLNIVRNAIEAMPKGGKLTVVTRMSDQFTSVQADGKKHRLMVVKVSDTGGGIKQDASERHLHAVLHDQGQRRGTGARAFLPDRTGTPGHDPGREPGKGRNNVQHLPSSGRMRNRIKAKHQALIFGVRALACVTISSKSSLPVRLTVRLGAFWSVVLVFQGLLCQMKKFS